MNQTTQQIELPEVLTRGVAEVLPGAQVLAAEMQKRKIRLYLGIDPTGNFLTLGHSVVLRKLQQFAELGHEVILLIGNGTVRIGDPTGRDSTRPELTDEQIKENFKDWQKQASKILDFDKIQIKYNGDWLDKMNFQDIVKLMAKTTVQQLMERDMFQNRVENGQPIFAHEIIYPLLQGYDSVAMDVDLEVGGTDQTFNMMMGRTLQKAYHNKEKWVLTTPIINGTDGRKMSKSYDNFVALTENPIDMYGKLMKVVDEEIITYFTVLTDVPMAEIETMAAELVNGANPMDFKKRLAKEITTMYHDAAAAKNAQEHFEKTVQGNELPAEMPQVSVEGIETVLDLLQKCLPDESNSQLRRLVDQGGVKLLPADKVFDDAEAKIEIKPGQVLKIGKRRFFHLSDNL